MAADPRPHRASERAQGSDGIGVSARGQLRWALADETTGTDGTGHLFPEARRTVGQGEYRGMEFLEVDARRLINPVPEAAGLGFTHTINAYRGCSHACTYCFARPTHDYLGLGTGEDFERRIVVKVNAAERLRAELRPAHWAGEAIAMGTNTDPYQRCEGKYRLTRRIVEVLTEAANPFSILTKSTLVLRDTEVLAAAARTMPVRVNLSIGTLDEATWRATEPGTPHPQRRLRAVEALNAAGIPCGVLIAPVLPGLSDGEEQLRAVATAVVEAGAVSVTTLPLHLKGEVRQLYLDALAETHPELVGPTQRRYRGAHASRTDRERIQAVVADAVRAAGGTRDAGPDPHRSRGRSVGAPRRRPSKATPAEPAARQMSLL